MSQNVIVEIETGDDRASVNNAKMSPLATTSPEDVMSRVVTSPIFLLIGCLCLPASFLLAARALMQRRRFRAWVTNSWGGADKSALWTNFQ